MTALRVSVSPLDLPLVHPFRIARGEELVAHGALVRVHDGEVEGLGEATPIERYGESYDSVAAYFATHELASNDPFRLEALLHDGIPAAARAGLDIALHDLIGKRLGVPLYALFGLDPSRAAVTSFTIGIAEPGETMRKLEEIVDHPILKIKLGLGTAREQVATIEAMKMKTEVRSKVAGKVSRIAVKVNDTVETGQVLMTLG